MNKHFVKHFEASSQRTNYLFFNKLMWKGICGAALGPGDVFGPGKIAPEIPGWRRIRRAIHDMF
jgi:hypothetical protein